MRVGRPKFDDKSVAYLITAEVWLELSSQNFQSGALSDTVSPYETEDLARSRSGETVELEGIGGVSMSDCGC